MNIQTYFEELGQFRIYIRGIWVDGSFTTKQVIPKDIDLVIFIDGDELNKNFTELDRLRTNFKTLHIFYAEWYPQNHSLSVITLYEKEKWRTLFNTDRIGNMKGLVEIKI